MRLDVPDFCRQPRRPVDRLRPDAQPFRIHVRERGGERQHAPARRLVGSGDVELRRVDVEADEIVGRGNDLQFRIGEFRRVLAGVLQKPVGVFAFQDDAEEAGVEFARRHLGGANVLRRVECRHAGRDVFGRTHSGARAPMRADRLHGEAVRQRHMVADLVDVGVRQFEAGRVDAPAIAEIHEPSGFVDREDRPDAIADARRHMAGIIAERFRGFAGSPAADPVLRAPAADPSDRASRRARCRA